MHRHWSPEFLALQFPVSIHGGTPLVLIDWIVWSVMDVGVSAGKVNAMPSLCISSWSRLKDMLWSVLGCGGTLRSMFRWNDVEGWVEERGVAFINSGLQRHGVSHVLSES